MRRVAYPGYYYAAELPPSKYRTLDVGGAQAPTEANTGRTIKTNQPCRAVSSLERKRRAMVDSFADLKFDRGRAVGFLR